MDREYGKRFADCMALHELPFFEKGGSGRLRVKPGLGLKVIDAHTHIGLSYLFRGKIDLWKRTEKVFHNFPAEGNPIDLDNYGFRDLTEENRRKMQKDLVGAVFFGSERARTHTIPNLLAEMDDMCVTHSIVLAVEVRFVFRNTQVILDNVKNEDRLVPFCCIHPAHSRMEERLENFIAGGARGMKFHPVFQTIGPEDPRSLRLFALCVRHGLPILSHTSASGSEPAAIGGFGRLDRFGPAIEAAEGVPFILGHSGMGDQYKQAIDYAVMYDNVYLEVSGQPLGVLREMFDRVDHGRILFGTDWPFYHMSMQLAKVLVATDGDEALRRKILYENSAKLLGI